MPDNIAVDLTSDYQMAKLSRLKEWLYRKQTQAREGRRQAEWQQKKEGEQPRDRR